MNAEIKKIIANLELNAPASQEDIMKAQTKLGLSLPKEYVDFLLVTNGGVGNIGTNSYFYLDLWKIEDTVPLNEGYQVNEFAPGLLIFGSDGGGTAFAFDTRDKAMPIVDVPFIPLDLDEAMPIAETFNSFLEHLSNWEST